MTRRSSTSAAFARRVMLAALLATAGGGVARAQDAPPRRTAVLRLELDGKVSEVLRDQLFSHLFDSLAASGFQVFSAEGPVKEMLKNKPELGSCAQPGCFREIANILGADYLVIGRVEARQKNYDLQLQLVSGRTGEKLAATHEKCELCGLREASEQMDAAAAGLRPGLDRAEAPASYQIESNPGHALVLVDGKPVGFTPLAYDMPVGVHEVELGVAGYASQRRAIEVTPGKPATLKFDLEAVASGGPGGSVPQRRWGTIGLVGVVVGAAAIGAGVYLLSLNGSETSGLCPGETDQSKCIPTRNTLWGGAALTGGGAALLGAGLFSLYVRHVASGDVASVGAASSSTGTEASLGGGWVFGARGTF
jgi:hypothetical protein